MKCLLYSRYASLGASSRLRFLQYISYFERRDVEVTVMPLFSNVYVSALYTNNSKWEEVFKGYFIRFLSLFTVFKYDLIIVEKELFPYMPAIAERLLDLLGVRYLVDYDDAIFHNYDRHNNPIVRRLLGNKIDVVMRCSSMVTVGNKYLAERARLAGAQRIEIIPTVVEASRYKVAQKTTNQVPIVGWIGTPKTSIYLQPLLPIFEAIKKDIPVRFVAVGARQEDFEGTAVEAWPWTEETEVSLIQQFDIGIMPLRDSPWERGKCGYKLIQYMACGVAVIASPVGVNSEIVELDVNGKFASSLDEWEQALRELLALGSDEIHKLGKAGRKNVEEWYSLEVQAQRFLEQLVKATLKNIED